MHHRCWANIHEVRTGGDWIWFELLVGDLLWMGRREPPRHRVLMRESGNEGGGLSVELSRYAKSLAEIAFVQALECIEVGDTEFESVTSAV